MKRSGYLNWDQYFMGLAKLSALRSKDPTTCVGAVIVSRDNKILAIGYNGFPQGCDDDSLPWSREGNYEDTKYAYVVHAEANAILNAHSSLKDAILYVTLFPCNECMKLIIQAGITELVYESNRDHGKPFNLASNRMMKQVGIKARQMQFNELTLTKHHG
jgi:dCMP deaminase